MTASCSALWDTLSAWGTAGRASFWVALEQNGSWGRDALVESGLDPEIGAALSAAAGAAGGKILLIRRPGRHAQQTTPHRVAYVAGGLSSSPWLRRVDVSDPAELLGLPWDELAGSRPLDAPGFEESGPVLLVCTNAKRDRCCALRGRPVLTELAAAGRDVWECTHTGGHRFAPTGVVLPSGQVLARVTPELGAAALDAAASGRLAVETFGWRHDRGRSHLDPRAAAAESWVRAETGETSLAALNVEGADDHWVVRHGDGRSWALRVESITGAPLPESCGKEEKPSKIYRVAAVGPASRQLR
ncbi:MAG: sucrase ferredoxin [Propioniciclava sp.]|uniref:sucrase ferredoxin n=1 Tax=Propioniciclava sp. TaxID=2038686 RepID=UPI0039E2E06A